MNCPPTPLPTFFSPAGSNFGPPTHWLPLPPVFVPLVAAGGGAGGVVVVGFGAGAGVGVGVDEEEQLVTW
jgi:hypothetical protein